MATRQCIISLATARSDYARGLARLKRSLGRVGYRGEVLLWPSGSFPSGCPGHLEVPFAFKPFCFAEAARRGAESVLWLDASAVAIRPLDPIFERLESRGYVIFANGSLILGEWASDVALEELGVSRDDAFEMREVRGNVLGLNLTDPTAAAFLRAWLEAAKAEVAFRGTRESLTSWDDFAAVKSNRSQRVSAHPRVRGHRHDQTVAGVLAHRLGMRLTTKGVEGYSRKRRRHKLFRPSTMVVIDRKRSGRGAELALRVRLDKQLGRLDHFLRRYRATRALSRPFFNALTRRSAS